MSKQLLLQLINSSFQESLQGLLASHIAAKPQDSTQSTTYSDNREFGQNEQLLQHFDLRLIPQEWGEVDLIVNRFGLPNANSTDLTYLDSIFEHKELDNNNNKCAEPPKNDSTITEEDQFCRYVGVVQQLFEREYYIGCLEVDSLNNDSLVNIKCLKFCDIPPTEDFQSSQFQSKQKFCIWDRVPVLLTPINEASSQPTTLALHSASQQHTTVALFYNSNRLPRINDTVEVFGIFGNGKHPLPHDITSFYHINEEASDAKKMIEPNRFHVIHHRIILSPFIPSEEKLLSLPFERLTTEDSGATECLQSTLKEPKGKSLLLQGQKALLRCLVDALGGDTDTAELLALMLVWTMGQKTCASEYDEEDQERSNGKNTHYQSSPHDQRLEGSWESLGFNISIILNNENNRTLVDQLITLLSKLMLRFRSLDLNNQLRLTPHQQIMASYHKRFLESQQKIEDCQKSSVFQLDGEGRELQNEEDDEELYLNTGCFQLAKNSILLLNTLSDDAIGKDKFMQTDKNVNTKEDKEDVDRLHCQQCEGNTRNEVIKSLNEERECDLKEVLFHRKVPYHFHSCRLFYPLIQSFVILVTNQGNPLHDLFKYDQENLIAVKVEYKEENALSQKTDGEVKQNFLNKMVDKQLQEFEEISHTKEVVKNLEHRKSAQPDDITIAKKYLYYLSKLERLEAFTVDGDSLTASIIADEFVNRRQVDKYWNQFDLERWLALCRLKTFSEGRVQSNINDWKSMVELDVRRKKKIKSKN